MTDKPKRQPRELPFSKAVETLIAIDNDEASAVAKMELDLGAIHAKRLAKIRAAHAGYRMTVLSKVPEQIRDAVMRAAMADVGEPLGSDAAPECTILDAPPELPRGAQPYQPGPVAQAAGRR